MGIIFCFRKPCGTKKIWLHKLKQVLLQQKGAELTHVYKERACKRIFGNSYQRQQVDYIKKYVMTAIDEYDDFCREYVVPQLEDDAVNGRWRGTIPSCFKVKKGVDQYIIYYDYRVENYMDLQLGLWGV